MAASERVALVTGASFGIGVYTALGLAGRGYRVIMHGRDPARTERARKLVAERPGTVAPETAIGDFASLAAVRALADEILARRDRLDLLVNNAGLIAPSVQRSADGYELTVAVNHLAPFLLTNLLLDRLKGSVPSRIVTVASQAHRGATLDPEHFAEPPKDWSRFGQYGRSKLCNILFTRALARRLEGSGVMAACLHPGVVATGIGGGGGGLLRLGWNIAKPFMLTPEKGAETSLFLATDADPAEFHGGYVDNKRIAEPDRAARDDALAERLWDASARLVRL